MAGSLIGQILLGQFRVEDFLAAGGMGAVYRVWDLKRQVPLAMKVLRDDFFDDPSLLRHFKREAKALEDLQHPHIVPFYGLYQSGHLAFMLEGYIDGQTLREILRGNPRLPLDESLTILKGVSAALSYAHARQIVHCDIKPSNVMIDQGGNVFLTDFGIARQAETVTTTFAMAGTAAYIAPEQVLGKPVTAATDVYALGVMAYEMLAGRRPFTGNEAGTGEGKSTGERLRLAHLRLPPPDPRRFNPQMPEAAADVLRRALSKNPAERYAEAWQFFRALAAAYGLTPQQIPERVRALRPVQRRPQAEAPFPASAQAVSGRAPRPPGEAPPRATPGSGTYTPPTAEQRPRARRLPYLPAVFIGLAALLAAGSIFALWRASAPSAAAPATSPAATATPPRVLAAALSTHTPQPTATPSPSPTPTGPQPGAVRYNPRDNAALVFIPKRKFLMGLTPEQVHTLENACSESGCEELYMASSPAHQAIAGPFWIYKTEVSNAMYARCVAAHACSPPRKSRSETHSHYYGNPDFLNYPVTYVSWYQARDYCRWAGGRLPTSAEWELAARGTDGRLFPWGNAFPTRQTANVENFYPDLMPVDAFPNAASPFGVLNMTGNVWEWVSDWYSQTYYSLNTQWDHPQGPAQGDRKNGAMLKAGRGGNYWIRSAISSVAIQDWDTPSSGGLGDGFRCVMDTAP